jgi:hypothetical protein
MQGGQILGIIFFGQFFEVRSSQNIGYFSTRKKLCNNFAKKLSWGTLWATFSKKTYHVALFLYGASYPAYSFNAIHFDENKFSTFLMAFILMKINFQPSLMAFILMKINFQPFLMAFILMKINFQPFCRNGIGVNETKKSRCTDWND